jgi:hypothetical protein
LFGKGEDKSSNREYNLYQSIYMNVWKNHNETPLYNYSMLKNELFQTIAQYAVLQPSTS